MYCFFLSFRFPQQVPPPRGDISAQNNRRGANSLGATHGGSGAEELPGGRQAAQPIPLQGPSAGAQVSITYVGLEVFVNALEC